MRVSFMGVKNYHSAGTVGRGIAPFWQISGQKAIETVPRNARGRSKGCYSFNILLQDVAPQVRVVHDCREVVANEVTIHDDLVKVVLGKSVEHRLEQCREHRL